MSNSHAADMENAQCARSIHIVGFPHRTNQTANASILELVKDLVPEAQVVRHDIFSTGPRLRTTDQYTEDDDESSTEGQEEVEWGNNGLQSGAEKMTGNLSSPGREDKDEKESPGRDFNNAAEHTEIAAYSAHPHEVSDDILSRAWIERNALALLDTVLLGSLERERSDQKILLAGYGFGGIIVKQAIIIANTTPKYYNLAFKISNLVFFATPHRLIDRLSWGDILLDMLEATIPSWRGRLLRTLDELADSISQLSFLFYRFLAKYPMTNFIEGKDYGTPHSVVGKRGRFDNDLEEVVLLHDDNFSSIVFCDNQDLRKLELLRMHFFPPLFSDKEIFTSLYGESEAAMDDSYFQALQAFSPSYWIVHETGAPNHPNGFNDLKEMYQSCINAISWEGVQERTSVQVVGPPGYGKSTFVKFISHEIRQHSPTVVIENFLSSTGAHQPTLHRLYVSFLHQAISQRPALFWSFRNLADEILRRSTWSEESLRHLLTSMLYRARGIKFQIIIYDFENWPADIRSWWCSTLSGTLKACGSNFVFITSSHHLISDLDPSSRLMFDLEEEYSTNKEEFIRTRVKSIADLGYGCGGSCSGLSNNLLRKIASKATMFQGSPNATSTLLLLLFERFRLSTPEAVMVDVQESPQTETELYSLKLQSLQTNDRRVLYWIASTLSWLLSPVRPLRVEELAAAAAINLKEPHLDNLRRMVSMNMERDLQRQLGSIVTVDNRVVRFSNTFATRTLNEDEHTKQLLSLENNSGLTKLCLHYLTVILKDKKSKTWERCLSHVSAKVHPQLARDPALEFLDYSCRFWFVHFAKVKDPEESLRSAVVEFLLDQEIAGRWFQLYLLCNSISTYPFEEDGQRIMSARGLRGDVSTESQKLALLIASFVGVGSVIPQILSHSSNPKIETLSLRRGYSERDASYSGPERSLHLDCAISNDDPSTVLALLEADQTLTTHEFPLHRAALLGCSKTVQALLQLPQYPEQIDKRERTPLHMAAIGGNTGTIQLFLDSFPHMVATADGNSRTPLIHACRMGNIDATRLLIDFDANVSIKDNLKKTALHYAVLNCPEVIQDLTHRDVSLIEAQDSHGRTPLHIAARSGSQETTSILLRSADNISKAINIKDDSNKIPLHYASENGYTDVVQVLLGNDAGSNVDNENYFQAAERAAEHGHLATMKAFTLPSSTKREPDQRLLETACGSGQLLVVRHLLSKNVSPDGDGSRDSRPLSLAVSNGHKEVIDALLGRQATVNIEDASRRTPLHYAAMNCRHEIAQTLLHKEANVNAPDFNRYTPLHEASRAGCVQIIEILLKNGAYIEASSRRSETPLHLATEHPEAVKKLLKWKADKDARDMFEQTPLHMATLKNSYESVVQLIHGGASIDARDDDGLPPIYHAIKRSDLEMTKILCENLSILVDFPERMQQALEWAVESLAESSAEPSTRSIKLELLEYLLGRSVDSSALNTLGSLKSAVIHRIVEMDSPTVLQLLLDKNADVNLPDKCGRTPLHLATREEKLKNMEILLENGAAVDTPDEDEETALHVAAGQGNTKAMAILLKYGAGINKKSGSDGRTPLFIAAYRGQVEAVQLLLEHGADMQATDDGWSPLHASADNPEITKILLAHGADVNLKKEDQWTPLHLAAHWSQQSVAEVLLENGANPNELNEDGETALHLAIRRRYTEVAGLLLAKGADCKIYSEKALSCPSLAVDYDIGSGEILEKLLIASSASGEPWHSEEATALYWRAVEKKSLNSLNAIKEKASHLFGKVNNRGLTALGVCLCGGDEDWELATQLVRLGVCPFFRNKPEDESCFELGFASIQVRWLGSGFFRVPLKKRIFHETCLQFMEDASTVKSMGFKDLRIITELDEFDFWKKDGITEALNSLQLAGPLTADPDGWNIWHFIHQAGDRVPIQMRNELLANPTKKPSRLLRPSSWVSKTEVGRIVEIAPGGLEASFAYHLEHPVSLRADFPFPPRDMEMAYFEITICNPDEHSSESDFSDDYLVVGIGFCGEFCNLNNAHTGWVKPSVGYHSDDGCVFESNDDWPAGRSFNVHDTVGCGIDYTTKAYYFTLNGEMIYRSTYCDSNDIIFRKLYPTICHRGSAVKVLVNFGDKAGEFAWSGARKQKEEDGWPRLRRRKTHQDRDRF